MWLDVLFLFCGLSHAVLLINTDPLNVVFGNGTNAMYDSQANSFRRPWSDALLWTFTNSSSANSPPADGDDVQADFSSKVCSSDGLLHTAIAVSKPTARLNSLTLFSARVCPATLIIDSASQLDAKTITVHAGVRLVVYGSITCKKLTLQKGGIIFGAGTIACDSMQLDGDIAPGAMFITAHDKGAESTRLQLSTNCAPGFFGNPAFDPQVLGQVLRFVGTATVTGNLWINVDSSTSFNSVQFSQLSLVYPATVHVFQGPAVPVNTSFPCITFDSLLGPLNFTATTHNYSNVNEELPWVLSCNGDCLAGKFGRNGQACIVQIVECPDGACVSSIDTVQSCASQVGTTITVIVSPQTPTCTNVLFLSPGQTIGGNGTSSGGGSATTAASGGLSTTTIIIIAVVVPCGVLFVVGFAILMVYLRHWEIARHNKEIGTRLKEKEHSNLVRSLGANQGPVEL